MSLEAESWDGGLLPSTPGSVRCGSFVCAPGYQCCVNRQGSPASTGCGWRSANSCRLDARTCDEIADCGPGELCCIGVRYDYQAPTLESYCQYQSTTFREIQMTTCDRGYNIACGSDDDCNAVSAPPCVAQRCRGDVVQTCGRLPANWCPP
jgi:hypothetical protein